MAIQMDYPFLSILKKKKNKLSSLDSQKIYKLAYMTSGGGRGAGRPSPCKKISLSYQYLIKVIEIFFWPPLIYNLIPLIFFSCSAPVHDNAKLQV